MYPNEFNKKFKNCVLLKVIGNNHKNFQYKLGLNVNDEKQNFHINGYCNSGLYFTNETEIFRFFRLFGDKVAHIKLIKNEPIWIEDYQCKTNSFEITKIESIYEYVNNLSEQLQINMVESNSYTIKYISNPSEQVKLQAVKSDGFVIQYISNSSEQVKLQAVKSNGSAIQYISNPSEQVKLQAVKSNDYAIQYISNPSEQVKLQAEKSKSLAINFFLNL